MLTAKFCDQCGTAVSEEKPLNDNLPYVGKSVDRGVYRITFDPVEGEFDSEDAAHDAARHSCWNEDCEFEHAHVERAYSTVPAEEFPFICSNCEEYVSPTKEGKCGDCGAVAWVRREE
jgi:hypothetical protein